MADRLMLLDSASLYFRAFFGVPDTVRSPDGVPVNAVRGFLDMVATLVAEEHPTHLVACWDDDWRPEFRVRALPSYKAHRLSGDGVAEEVPAALTAQVPVIVDVLAALGVPRVGAPGYEADDVIASLAERAASGAAVHMSGAAVDIVTGDRDLFQLVDDRRGVRVLYIGRGVRRREVVDQAWLRERYAVPDGAGYAEMAVLRGDPSDGLPGVPGVGEKTAAGLLRTYRGLAGLLAAVDDETSALPPARRASLRAARGYLQAAPAVVTCVRDIALPDLDAALPTRAADLDALVALADTWGIRSSVNRVLAAFRIRPEAGPG